MDSFNVIRVEDISDELLNVIDSIESIDDEHVSAAWRSIKTAQMMEDRWQLFEMFCWNYERYSEGLESYVSDRVMTTTHCESVEQAFQRTRIDVNCYCTNLISSGVTLVESLRCIMKCELGESNSSFQQFESMLKGMIDKGGAYALMTKLRDEAQHGQALVSLYADDQGRFRAAFDLDQLMNPEHFSIKGLIKRIMQDKLDQMDKLDARHHRISYTWCMERYYIEVLEAVAAFYSCSADYIQETDKLLCDCIGANSACCGQLNDGRKIIWVINGGAAHTLIDVETSGYSVHVERRSEVENKLSKAKHRFDCITTVATGPGK